MINRLNPSIVRPVTGPFERIYSHGSRVENPDLIVLLSGQIGVSLSGEVLETFEAQCLQAMAHVEALLAGSGLNIQDILRVTYYVTDPSYLDALVGLRRRRWGSDEPPAVTTLVVQALAATELLVEIEVTAGR